MFVVVVDPYNLDLLINDPAINGATPTLQFQNRLVKAAGIIRNRPTTLLLGSSIVDQGFPVPGGIYRDGRAEMVQQSKSPASIYNAGVSGGGLKQAIEMVQHGFINNPRLNRVILGLEWSQFTTLTAERSWPTAPILYHRAVFPLGYEKYLTWTGLNDAVRTVQANQNLPQEGLDGLIRPADKLLRSLLQASWPTRSALAAEAPGHPSFTARPVDLRSDFMVTSGNAVDTRHFIFANWFATGLELREHGAMGLRRLESYDDARTFFSFTKQNNINSVLYISPQPTIYWALVRHVGLWPSYTQWLRDVADIHPYLDFSFMPEIDQDDSFPWDALHFSQTLGQTLLKILLSAENARSDVRVVTRDNIDEEIEARASLLDAWLDHHPYERKLVSLIDVKSRKTDALSAMLSVPYDPPYKGFRIIKIFDRFYGLPQNEPTYDYTKVLSGGYKPMVSDDSFDLVIKDIDDQRFDDETGRKDQTTH